MMKYTTLLALCLFSSLTMADPDDAVLDAQMRQACAPLFAAAGFFANAGPCANVTGGARNCVLQNIAQGGASCVAFEKEHDDFFDDGKDEPIVR
ncbi:hypothetical protein TI04_07280 [Achromatium sp. WMS2]|nr:hypothetical protein TI04_07280 [Achromatium sp. WMS2]